jgi:hypothetical protein
MPGSEEKDMPPVSPEKDWTDTAREYVQQARAILNRGGGGGGKRDEYMKRYPPPPLSNVTSIL